MESGSVDLVYLDPPFCTGRDFGAFSDKWGTVDIDETLYPQFMELVNSIHGKNMAAYLSFMSVRLLEMRRILKDTGSIYLHCDPTASHYLKLLMDGVFGSWVNFRK